MNKKSFKKKNCKFVIDLDKLYEIIGPYVDINDWATRGVLNNAIFLSVEVENESIPTINPSKDESLIDEHRIYESAILTFRANNQILMMFEEMSELQKELCKNFRGKDNKEQIAEELADVYIMLQQMIILFDCNKSFDYHKTSKLRRLEKRIENARRD